MGGDHRHWLSNRAIVGRNQTVYSATPNHDLVDWAAGRAFLGMTKAGKAPTVGWKQEPSSFLMKLEMPAGDFRAYLFDCDGTIADSMPLHYRAWKKALAEYGCTYEEELFYAWGGKPVRKIIADLNARHGLAMPVEPLAARKEAYYLEQLPTLQPIPAVLEHIEAQYGRIPLAVVSGSRRDSVLGSLKSLHLLDRFDTLVCAEDYKHGKPAPDAFLLAAERLGVEPAACLVFEDTELGIEAATAAGMASVRVPQVREGTKAELPA